MNFIQKVLLITILIAAPAKITSATQIDSVKHPFGINLPDNWEEIVKSEIVDSSLRNLPNDNFNYLCKRKDSKNVYEYPFILISINETPQSPYFRNLAESEDKSISFDDLQNLKNKFLYEKNTRWLWQKSVNSVHSVISIIIPGGNFVINLNLYNSINASYEDQFEAYNIIRSIKIPDQYIKIQNEETSSLYKFITSKYFNFIFAFIFIGLPLIILTIFIIKKREFSVIPDFLAVIIFSLSILIIPLIAFEVLLLFSKSFALHGILFPLLQAALSFLFIITIGRGDYSKYGFNKIPIKKVFRPLFITLFSLLITSILLFFILSYIGPYSSSLFKFLADEKFYVLVIIPPAIIEEIIFRGVIQSHLSKLKIYSVKIKKAVISLPVLYSALFFAIMHSNFNGAPEQNLFFIKHVLFALSFGLFAGYYRERFNSIYISMAMHVSANILFGLLAVWLSW